MSDIADTSDGLAGSDGLYGGRSSRPSFATSDASDSSDGLNRALVDIVVWLERFIIVADQRDLELIALWAAHTHAADVFYTTPRLIIDSAMPGSGKTTLLEHLMRLAKSPVQAASITSAALLTRLIQNETKTLMIDEADRSLDPRKPGVEDLIAIINSGYKRGATRPVLMPAKGGEWVAEHMPTFSPVAMAGNAPHLPDDTRSRALRIVLMPDLEWRAEDSDWENLDADGYGLGARLADAVAAVEERIRVARPDMPDGCRGRAKERWSPLARIAHVAGAPWDRIVTELIQRDLEEVEHDLRDGLANIPPAVQLATHLFEVWPETRDFVRSNDLITLIVEKAPETWGDQSSYGKRLTAQRMGRMLSQAFKIHTSKRFDDLRGYHRASFETVWRRFGLTPSVETVGTGDTVRTVGGAS